MELIFKILKKNSFNIFVLIIFLAIAGSTSFFGRSGDEHENFVAGWLITKGLLPYRDFFFHHAPLPFFISSLLSFFSGSTFAVYRIFILAYYFITWTILLVFTDEKLQKPLLITSILVAIAMPPLNGQMFLADTFASISFMAILILYASYVINQQPPSTQLYILVTIFSFIGIWSSITIIVPFIIATALFFLMISPTIKETNQAIIGRDTAIFLGVHLLIPAYFVIRRSFSDFFWGVYQYNSKYYFPLRLAEDDTERSYGMLYRMVHQSWKFFSQSATEVFNAFIILAQTIKGVFHEYIFTHSVPLLLKQIWIAIEYFFTSLAFTHTAAFIALVVIGALALRKSFTLFFGFIMLMMALRIRSNELFHLIPFYYVLFFLLTLTLFYTIKTKKFLHSIASIFAMTIVILTFVPIYFESLTNPQPIISKQETSATSMITKHSEPGEKLLSIAANPIVYQLADRMPSTRYIYYYDWFHKTPQIRHELEQSLLQRSADVVYVANADSQYTDYFAPEIVTLIQNRYDKVDDGVYRIGDR